MKIAEIFEKKQVKPVISFEIFPPKRDESLRNIDGTLDILAGLHPDFISVTFGAGGSITNSQTLNIAEKIMKHGIEAVSHLTCLYYTREEILTMIKQMQEHGISNVLALRGDPNPAFSPKKDFSHASDLIKFIKKNSDLGISAACYPEGHQEAKNLDEDIVHLKEKVDAGAEHLISQLFFDNDIFFSFMDKIKAAGINVPVDAGVMPVINTTQINRMATLCGATVPEKFQRIMNRYGNNKEALFDAGMAYCVDQIIDLIARGADGIHVYTMNNTKVAERICSAIKNLV